MDHSLEQLSAVWHWAKANTNVPNDVVDQHIENLKNALNQGRAIIPCFDVDTDGTLTRFRPPEDNLPLFKLGKLIQHNSNDNLYRDFIVCSSERGLAIDTAHRLDPNFCNIAGKTDIHPHGIEPDFLREMLVDDQARFSRYKDRYVSLVIPTWDKGLIAFPQPK